jgi:hypothetical protein
MLFGIDKGKGGNYKNANPSLIWLEQEYWELSTPPHLPEKL